MSDCSRTSTGCSGCGECCDPVYLPLGPGDITRALANPRVAGRWRRDLVFFRNHWKPTGEVHVGTKGGIVWVYRCAKYDTQAHACTTYANRPLVCEEHPLYENHRADLAHHLAYLDGEHTPHCSYRAMGKTRLVIVAVTGRAA